MKGEYDDQAALEGGKFIPEKYQPGLETPTLGSNLGRGMLCVTAVLPRKRRGTG